MQIKIKVKDVSKADKLKLNKIFKLSISRKKQYILVEKGEDILVTSNPAYKSMSDTLVVTMGDITLFPTTKIHIKSPLLGIRVLKTLDAVEISMPSINTELDTRKNKTLNEVKVQNKYDVLIVDDSVLIHKALELEFQKAELGAHLFFAESGEQCLETIKDKKFDLIFLDVMMPGIDGFDTCTEIRKQALYKKTPIIMLSAKTSPLDEVKGIMAGCSTYLTKPIKDEEFQKLLIRMDKWLTPPDTVDKIDRRVVG